MLLLLGINAHFNLFTFFHFIRIRVHEHADLIAFVYLVIANVILS